ncbi:MAG: hypothetical protein R3C15_15770 [Thermoleophilia bacterium]
MLIASAALSSWEGLRRSVVLLGLGEIGLTAGSLIYSYYAVQGDYVDDRWANVAWSAGALFSILAACVVILLGSTGRSDLAWRSGSPIILPVRERSSS